MRILGITLLGSQKYVKEWSFGLLFEGLVHCFTYFYRPGRKKRSDPRYPLALKAFYNQASGLKYLTYQGSETLRTNYAGACLDPQMYLH